MPEFDLFSWTLRRTARLIPGFFAARRLRCAQTSLVVQVYDSQLINFKVALQRAQTEKASVATVRDTAAKNYRELLDYSNSRTDENERNSLSHELERLAQEVNRATATHGVADQMVRQAQKQMADIERDRAVAQSNCTLATERWEQIRKQLDEAGPQL